MNNYKYTEQGDLLASSLGKIVAKRDNYRLVKEGVYHRLYRVSRELIFSADYSQAKYGKRQVAVALGYVSNPENFEIAIYEAEEEMRYLMAQGI